MPVDSRTRPQDSPWGQGQGQPQRGTLSQLLEWGIGDRHICSCLGKTRLCSEQALTPLLTSSLLVQVLSIPHSPLHSFEVLDYLGPPRRQGQSQGEESKKVCLSVQGLMVTEVANLGF